MDNSNRVDELIGSAKVDFERQNARAARINNKELIPEADWVAVRRIAEVTPRHIGVIDAADNWVVETWKEAARGPNENEWQRLRSGPLDGAIGMSFALQWRYNFGPLFGRGEREADDLLRGLLDR